MLVMTIIHYVYLPTIKFPTTNSEDIEGAQFAGIYNPGRV